MVKRNWPLMWPISASAPFAMAKTTTRTVDQVFLNSATTADRDNRNDTGAGQHKPKSHANTHCIEHGDQKIQEHCRTPEARDVGVATGNI